jgi:hypothetical protein
MDYHCLGFLTLSELPIKVFPLGPKDSPNLKPGSNLGLRLGESLGPN